MDNNTKPSIQPRTGRDFFAQGVTLIELIVTISIMAILLAMGAPSFQTAMVSNRLTSQTNTLVSALNLARSEAIKRNRLVAVAKTAVAWKDGWRVCVYLPAPQEECDPNEPDIQRYSAISGNLDIRNTVGFTNRVAYNPDGRSNNGHFDICSPGSTCEDFRQIVIADTGRVHVETPKSLKDKNEGSLPAGEPHQPLISLLSF